MKKKLELITLDQAVALSQELAGGYFTNPNSIKNLIYKGILKRHGPPKQVMVDRKELVEYLGVERTA